MTCIRWCEDMRSTAWTPRIVAPPANAWPTYFASRTAPDYDRVTSISDLANLLQVVQALSLAGKLDEAWSALSSPEEVLRRLEHADLLLALLTPWYPDGWRTRPEGVLNKEDIAATVTHALWKSGRHQDAEAQILFDIEDLYMRTLSHEFYMKIGNHARVLSGRKALAQAQRALDLARDVATALKSDHDLLHCDVFAIELMLERGECGTARDLWQAFEPKRAADRQCDVLDRQTILTEPSLLFREGTLTAAWLQNAIGRARTKGWRHSERSLLSLQGEWFQDQHKHTAALQSFDHALAMAREAGLSDWLSIVRRGLSLLNLGKVSIAEAAAASAERNPPHASLATLYLALGQHDKARRHALEGYKLAWANGPPYCERWKLEECGAVLKALNEPEPVLPPYDAAKIPSLPYEDVVRRKIAEHLAGNEAPVEGLPFRGL